MRGGMVIGMVLSILKFWPKEETFAQQLAMTVWKIIIGTVLILGLCAVAATNENLSIAEFGGLSIVVVALFVKVLHWVVDGFTYHAWTEISEMSIGEFKSFYLNVYSQTDATEELIKKARIESICQKAALAFGYTKEDMPSNYLGSTPSIWNDNLSLMVGSCFDETDKQYLIDCFFSTNEHDSEEIKKFLK